LPVRHEYALTLSGAQLPAPPRPPEGLAVRGIVADDLRALAELMLDAYRGTIDDEGEGIVEAIAEVEGYFSGAGGNPPLLEYSAALVRDDIIESACMIKHWRDRDRPLVGYIVSAHRRKRQGLATVVLAQSIGRLQQAGYRDVRAVITEGNTASERLFQRAGFQRIAMP